MIGSYDYYLRCKSKIVTDLESITVINRLF